MRGMQPVFILPEGTTKITGKSAQKMNIEAAKLVADQVKTTLGPKGMDKMIIGSTGDIIITNDGVTILDNMNIEHPTAKMIVEIAKTQDIEVGDGTTTAVILAGEFLKKAEDLLDKKIHPTIIAKGYELATKETMVILDKVSMPIDLSKTELLKSIAITGMTGKNADSSKEYLADLLVEAVTNISEKDELLGKTTFNLNNIKIEKKSGSAVNETKLIKGIILDKERSHSSMPESIKNPKVALINCAVEIKSTETAAKISINNPSEMQGFLDQEENMIKEKVDYIIDSGANVVFCQKGVDDVALYLLAKAGIYTCRRINSSDMEKLSKAIGCKIISDLKDLTEEKLGVVGLVEERFVGDSKMTFVEDCKNPKSVTILVRGSTEHVVDEVKRAIDDALGALVSSLTIGKIVGGAGAVEIRISKELRKYANSLKSKQQLAVQAFAEAIEIIPTILAESAGLDPIDKLAEMKATHNQGLEWSGINVFTGKVMDSKKERVIEPLKVKTQAIESASKVAQMILRIDDVINGKSSQNQPGPPGMPGMGMPMM